MEQARRSGATLLLEELRCAMACARCGDPDFELEGSAPEGGPLAVLTGGRRWCPACERAYDTWSRRHAGDIVWEVLSGTVIVAFVGMGLPLLGVSWLVAATGIFAGFGAFIGLHRLNVRRRRRQYLQGGEVPRAYLPDRT
jgi:hypothetical protein